MAKMVKNCSILKLESYPGPSYRLCAEIKLSAPLNAVFGFFSHAENLEVLTPPLLKFEIQRDQPVSMRTGALIDYRLRVHGIPIKWQSEITVWEPPYRFVDEQRKGPYRLWIHKHTFEMAGEKTLVKDEVRYEVPGGSLIHTLFVRPDLKKIFNYRHEKLLSLFSEKV